MIKNTLFSRIMILTGWILSFQCINAQYLEEDTKIYHPQEDSLKEHMAPEWFNNAKLGIFVHWGLYSVPAFAPTKGTIWEIMDVDRRDWFTNNAYAEWYLNTLRIKGSPTYNYHVDKYGADFNYYQFSTEFNHAISQWSPEEMAKVFKESGARYVVLTTKHHDGYTLWPSRVHNNNMPEHEKVRRDIVGELTDAVRKNNMKMGLYYSGGLDWTFNRTPITGDIKIIPDMTPQSVEYAAIADAHVRELVEKYQPSVLWNDIHYPKRGDLLTLLSDYYNLVPDGVINNRWGIQGLHDFTTPEYSKYEEVMDYKWESCRGLGYSFGFNQFEDEKHTVSSTELIHLLIDVVSKNGNLLINVGPKPDGTIPEIQLERLQDLGNWLKINGDAIFDTKPNEKYGGTTLEGIDFRYTQKDDKLYLTLLEKPERKISVSGHNFSNGTNISFLGTTEKLKWKSVNDHIEIKIPNELKGEHAFVLEISN